MTNPNDPKIVPGGDVQFADGRAQADLLEGAVQQAGESTGGENWVVENINYLAAQTWPVLRVTERFTADYHSAFREARKHDLVPLVQGLAVQILGLERAEQNRRMLRQKRSPLIIRAQQVDPPTFRRYLEAEYHPQIAQIGIYELTGLNRDEPVNMSALEPFFPEMGQLNKMLDRYILAMDNPYLTIFTFPPAARPFLTGALREMNPKIDNNKSLIAPLPLPLTLKEIFQYAEKVGELQNVPTYAKILTEVQ